MTANGSVSVVIPVYNGEQFVADAIRSALEQTAAPLECIVVDDGSTDSTSAVVRGFGSDVRYERQDNSGVSRARNRGVELARGELVAFLDHDDTWLPEKLELQIAEFRSSSALMVVCGVVVIDAHDEIIGHRRMYSPGDLLEGLVTFDGTEFVSCSSAGLMARRQFEAIGGFDPSLGMSADLDLLIQVLLSDSLSYVDRELVRYRIHGSNMSRNVTAMERDMVHLFAKVFTDPRLPASVGQRRRHAYARLYRMLAGSYLGAGDRRAALRTLMSALVREPGLAVDQWRRDTSSSVHAPQS